MDRFEEFCLISLSQAIGKPIPNKLGVDYSGEGGQFSFIIEEVNQTLREFFRQKASENPENLEEANFLKKKVKLLLKQMEDVLKKKNEPSNKIIETYSLFSYALLFTFFRFLSKNEGFDQIECKKEKRIMKELFDRTEGNINYNYQPQFHTSRIFSYLNYSDISLEAPSLELGISDGHTSNFVFRDNKLTVGTEPTISNILNARKYGNHKNYMCVDAGNICFKDKVFNTVISMNTIYHCKPKENAIKEMARVLAPGGILAFDDITESFISMRPFSYLFDNLGFNKSKNDFEDYRVKKQTYYTHKDYEEMLSSLGFETIECTPFMSQPLTALPCMFFDLDYFFMQGQFELDYYLKNYFRDNLQEVIPPMIARDQDLCESTGQYSYNRIIARKKGKPEKNISDKNILNYLLCPECHGEVKMNSDYIQCTNCLLKYPVIQGVPLMIPFYSNHYEMLMQEK
ncbi:MAG: methyltransferase domain-containing protein [Desulfobacteraceae bacterium]|nr:methyltransferase domain-containing protein [Desulfobacteraceae bacterium]